MIKKIIICLNYGHLEENKFGQWLYLKITISTKSLMSIPLWYRWRDRHRHCQTLLNSLKCNCGFLNIPVYCLWSEKVGNNLLSKNLLIHRWSSIPQLRIYFPTINSSVTIPSWWSDPWIYAEALQINFLFSTHTKFKLNPAEISLPPVLLLYRNRKPTYRTPCSPSPAPLQTPYSPTPLLCIHTPINSVFHSFCT